MNFFLFLTFAGAGLGAIVLFGAVFLLDTAPGQAASAAVAVGLAVIPYVMLRVVQISRQEVLRQERHLAAMKLLTLIENNTSKSTTHSDT